ncbi:MAG TPA: metal ABC transporter permease [Desulfobacteraceae bacterium]|jgi:zinc transport system permease protein|nr:metal ABC transporter permease [Desulfobacteraceae bacterium]
MVEFVSDVFVHRFLQYALLTGLLAGIACGVIGSYVVTRRITYIAGGISHSVLAGMGAAGYLSAVHGCEWLSPLHGAVVAALCAAMLIGYVSLHARQREDTVIGAVWAVGMAAGILFISKTPGYHEDLMSYLFGNILMVSSGDILLITLLDLVILTLVFAFYNQFLAVCFDEEFARIRGIRVEFFYLLLLCLTALTVVLLITVVGIVMVIALLTLPAAVAGQFSKKLWQMMILSSILSSGFTTLGLAVSYGPDLPAGATTILLAGAVYLAVTVGGRVFGK